MKFEKQFLSKMIPEMKQHYLDYKLLLEQIKLVRRAALTLGSAFADLNETTSQNMRYTIAVSSLETEQKFWQLLQENLNRVENWYNETMEKHLDRFHELTLKTIQIGLLQKYIPIERAQTTQLDREVERLGLTSILPWKHSQLPYKIPHASKCLVALTRTSDLNDVLMRARNGYRESRVFEAGNVEADFESEDDTPLSVLLTISDDDAIKAKNKKAEEPMPDMPPPNWDDEQSDDEEQLVLHNNPNRNAQKSFGYQPSSNYREATENMPSSSNQTYNSSNERNRYHPGYMERQIESGYVSESSDRGTIISSPSAGYTNIHTNLIRSQTDLGIGANDVFLEGPHLAPNKRIGGNVTNGSISSTPVNSLPSSLSPSRATSPLKARPYVAEIKSPVPSNSRNPSIHSSTIKTKSPIGRNILGSTNKTQVDNFFDDFDDDREEDIVETVKLDESLGPNQTSDNFTSIPLMLSNSSSNKNFQIGQNPYQQNTFMQNYGQAAYGQQNFSGQGGFAQQNFPGQNPMAPTNYPQASYNYNSVGANPMVPNFAPIQPFPKTSGTDSSREEQEALLTNLKREWSDFYRDLHLLKQFALLNVEAITKILIKHDKTISSGAKHRFLQLEGSNFAFIRREHLKLVIRETEHVYAQAFTGGHRTAAMSALRVSNEAPEVGMATFRFGFFLGLSIVMSVLIAFVCLITDSAYLVKLRPGLIVFRMLSLFTLWMWTWGLTMVICTTYRVNFTHIFEFPTRPLYQQVFELSAFFTLILTSSMLAFVVSGTQRYVTGFKIPLLTILAEIPIAVIPLSVFLLVLVLALFFQIRSGWWGARSIGRVLAAPFFPVTYQDFHTAELLLSSTLFLFDFQFSICYFTVDALHSTDTCVYSHRWINVFLAILPSMWRVLQCLRRWADLQQARHLVNAGKYSLGILVSLLAFLARVFSYLGNFWIALWVISLLVVTAVNSYWDIIQDWNLGETQIKYPYLRSTLLLPARLYYFAMIVTPFGRLIWGLTLSPDVVMSWLNADVFITMIAAVEIGRRTLWAILRLENEQISNSDNYRPPSDNLDPYPAFLGDDMFSMDAF